MPRTDCRGGHPRRGPLLGSVLWRCYHKQSLRAGLGITRDGGSEGGLRCGGGSVVDDHCDSAVGRHQLRVPAITANLPQLGRLIKSLAQRPADATLCELTGDLPSHSAQSPDCPRSLGRHGGSRCYPFIVYIYYIFMSRLYIYYILYPFATSWRLRNPNSMTITANLRIKCSFANP